MKNLKGENQTIVALSSPLGVGAIGVVRISGPGAIKIADKLFTSFKGNKPSSFEPRKMELGTFCAQNFKEQILCVVFVAPFSFTGENLVEFQCHGGIKIAEGIVDACINAGAVLAQNGEFSKRAFINGKLNLEKAEGMMNMIEAESEAEIRAGYSLLSGVLGKLAISCQKELTDLLSDIEVSFDYPEEDIEYITRNKTKQKIVEIEQKINELIKTSSTGRKIKEGVNLLILGEPNVGKSSLLNALSASDKAIVTNIAGTTRDTIEETILINGVKFNIIDTAGIRKTTDIIEKIGIDKAKDKIKSADLVIVLVDASKKQSKEDEEILKLTDKTNRIIVGNKIDLAKSPIQKADLYISTKDEKSVNNLKQKIYELTLKDNITNALIITNLRHLDALTRAQKALKKAIKNIDEDSLDLI